MNSTITVLIGSSGLPVAQSITVCMPTRVAGMVSGLLRSACTKQHSTNSLVKPQQQKKKKKKKKSSSREIDIQLVNFALH